MPRSRQDTTGGAPYIHALGNAVNGGAGNAANTLNNFPPVGTGNGGLLNLGQPQTNTLSIIANATTPSINTPNNVVSSLVVQNNFTLTITEALSVNNIILQNNALISFPLDAEIEFDNLTMGQGSDFHVILPDADIFG